MKLKLVIVDFEMTRRSKVLVVGALVGALGLGVGTIAFAAPPKTWVAGEPLTAADLNANFADVQSQADQTAANVTTLQSQLTSTATNVANLSTSVNTLQSQIGSLALSCITVEGAWSTATTYNQPTTSSAMCPVDYKLTGCGATGTGTNSIAGATHDANGAFVGPPAACKSAVTAGGGQSKAIGVCCQIQ